VSLIETQTSSGAVSAASLHVQHGKSEFKKSFGQARTPDAVFLLASITKPMTATAVVILSDRKKLSIDEPVRKYIPQFSGAQRDIVTIKHLLTHTSGLPDMLPRITTCENVTRRLRIRGGHNENAATVRSRNSRAVPKHGNPARRRDCRARHPASFVRLSPPGGVSAVRHEAHQSGLGRRPLSETMQSQVTADPEWNWNSKYWRELASPWGGAHSTASDVAVFLRSFADPKPRS
jgi:CubicO group peptidase (beta-lactamase class C family)